MDLLRAFGFGTLAQASLLLAGLLVCWVTVPTRLVGILAGFGAGAMIAAIAFDLVPESQAHIDDGQFALWALIGVANLPARRRLVDQRFGSTVGRGDGHRGRLGRRRRTRIGHLRHPDRRRLDRSARASSPQSSSPTSRRRSRCPPTSPPGWRFRRLGTLWLAVVLGCGVAAALGYLGTVWLPDAYGDRAAALAAAPPLAMLTNSLVPFADQRGKEWAGS